MTADISLQFCSAQNVFATDTTVDSTDWLDMKVAQDWAAGKAPVVEIIVTTTFSGGTSAQFQLLAVDAAGGNAVVLDQTPAIAIAGLVAPVAGTPGNLKGTTVHLRMSPKNALPTATLTHLRVRTVNVGANAAGAISAHLLPEVSSQHPGKAYPVGY